MKVYLATAGEHDDFRVCSVGDHKSRAILQLLFLIAVAMNRLSELWERHPDGVSSIGAFVFIAVLFLLPPADTWLAGGRTPYNVKLSPADNRYIRELEHDEDVQIARCYYEAAVSESARDKANCGALKHSILTHRMSRGAQ